MNKFWWLEELVYKVSTALLVILPAVILSLWFAHCFFL